jgi:(2S)-methylsuccinyl-CoA dehydrogenase
MSATVDLDKPVLVLPDLPALLSGAADAAQAFVAAAQPQVKARIADDSGRVDRVRADVEQHVVHGFGWFAAYAEMMREVANWAAHLESQDAFGEIEALLAQLLFAEYGAQMIGGIPMNQGEVIRPADLVDDLSALDAPAFRMLVRQGGHQAVKSAIARHLVAQRGHATLENCGLDEMFDMVREQFFALSNEKVAPFAHEWHLKDELIPCPWSRNWARWACSA